MKIWSIRKATAPVRNNAVVYAKHVPLCECRVVDLLRVSDLVHLVIMTQDPSEITIGPDRASVGTNAA